MKKYRNNWKVERKTILQKNWFIHESGVDFKDKKFYDQNMAFFESHEATKSHCARNMTNSCFVYRNMIWMQIVDMHRMFPYELWSELSHV